MAVRQYSLPILLALTLHLLAGMGLYANWNPAERKTRVIEPHAVQSTLVVMEPKSKPQPAPKPQRAPPPKAAPKPQPKPRPKPAAQTPQPKPDVEAQRARAESERRAAEERKQAEEKQRQERLEALSRQEFQKALNAEASQLAKAQAADDQAVASSFRSGIYQTVVANWSRPPSARNGMEAKLLVELVPTGDVVNVTLLQSSGNAAFDRSAEAAVKKAGRFEVPKDPDVFEDYFRRFTLLFRPEDLLR